MGRKARIRKDRKPIHIRLSGEQAEVFDEQMESDREWFEGSTEMVRFRPEIEGEWNEQKMLGFVSPALVTKDPRTGKADPANWTCVLDLGRVTGMTTEASGWRTRFPCSAPSTGKLRSDMAAKAIAFAQAQILLLKSQQKPPVYTSR